MVTIVENYSGIKFSAWQKFLLKAALRGKKDGIYKIRIDELDKEKMQQLMSPEDYERYLAAYGDVI